ncbi:protein kinase [Streptomyces sp. NPDC005955]|uniref:serine/threonine-protein kinase n=1 Tax=Streptomyces sp. NPDC005955 TaxID=3364738 RepID=UPI00369379CC
MSDAEQRGGARRDVTAALTGERSDEKSGTRSGTSRATGSRAGTGAGAADLPGREPDAGEPDKSGVQQGGSAGARGAARAGATSPPQDAREPGGAADAGPAAPQRAPADRSAPTADRSAGSRARGGRTTPTTTGERLLAGRYRLGDVLGRGGMGTVWRAKDETLGRTVAVKELRFPHTIDEEEKRRLITRTLREAKAIARIRNNSAVTVYDVVDEDDRPWIVMELVEGKSLAEAIKEDGLLTPRRAAEVGLAVLNVLRAAHGEGILHRDVKPSNVLIADDGRVVLTDFGIAQVEGDPSITSTGMLVGAPSYISPERARGHRPGPAADLWSLGGLLYASVEGIPPYDKGSAIATLTAVMTEPLDPPQNAGPLEEVIYGLLAKDPEQRLDDEGARALLTDVLNAPDGPAAAAADPTVVIAMPVVTEAALAEQRAQRTRGRGAERKKWSTRKAGAAAAGSAAVAGAGSARAAGAPPVAPPAPLPPPGHPGRPGARTAPPATGALPGAVSPAAAPKAGMGAGRPASTGAAHGRTGAPQSGPPGAASGAPVVTRSGGSRGPGASLTDVMPRRTLVVIAVVVALAVVAGVVALAMREDDTSGDESKGSDKVASSGASGGDGSTGQGTGGDAKDTGEDTGTGAEDPADKKAGGDAADPDRNTGEAGDSGKDTPDDTADEKPDSDADSGKEPGKESGTAAASTHRHDQGFSIGLPKGWKLRSTDLAGARYTGPNGQRLLVGWTTTPKDDAVADWKNQERSMRRAQYERVHIKGVDYRGWEAADWEFTYAEGGTRYRVTNRGFVVNSSQGYALMYTARAADWSGADRKQTWRTFTETFQPKS